MTDTEDAAAFGARAKAWLSIHAPEPVAFSDPEVLAVARRFQSALYDAGFAGITWPKQDGGQGRGAEYQSAYNEASADIVDPTGPLSIGLGMCGPTIVDLGTPDQRRRYVRPLLRGDEVWCQLYSESGAGSDVASLQTRAVREGDEWVITGSKVWTTNAQWADFGTLLARTDPDVPKHAGLTMFILDMRLPGVEVRPLRDMTGIAHFNEVFLDGVRVPADAVLGEVGAGWQAALIQLGHERVSIGGRATSRRSPLSFAALAEFAIRSGAAGDPVVRDHLVRHYALERALGLFAVRMRQEQQAGREIGARGSVAKLMGAIVARTAVDTVTEVAGAGIAGWDLADDAAGSRAHEIHMMPQHGIAGGTNEIQRKIIGEQILGLPREPSVDTNVPFRDLRVGTQRRREVG